MTWTERWEELKQMGRSDLSAAENLALREQKQKRERWDWSLHHADKSSGSETLDD